MKCYLTVLLIAAALMTTGGCAAAGGETLKAGPEAQVQEKLEAAEESIRRELRTMTAPEDAASVPENAITKEEARRIALEHLGLTEDQVRHLRTDYEIDDGISRYEVEFSYDGWEYEFRIHAATGKILHFDKDHKTD